MCHDSHDEEDNAGLFESVEGGMGDHLAVLWVEFLGCDIEAVDVVAIAKVVDEVPSQRVVSVIEATSISALSSSGKIGLQGRSSSV